MVLAVRLKLRQVFGCWLKVCFFIKCLEFFGDSGNVKTLFAESTPIGFPVIEAHPVMKSVESGRTAHLSCRVRGDPTPKILWLKNSIPGLFFNEFLIGFFVVIKKLDIF
jgi:hypothetical protein